MILKVPQTMSPLAALVMCQFKCGRLFGVDLQAWIEAINWLEMIFILIRNVYLQAGKFFCMFYFLVYPL